MNGRLMMVCCVLSCFTIAGGEVRAQEGSSLGTEYARLLMLSLADDIRVSPLRIHDGVAPSKFSLLYEMFRLELADRLSLSGTVRGELPKG